MSDEKDNDNEVQSEESDDESIDDEHDSEKYTQDTWDLAYICKFNIENYYTGLNKYLEDKKIRVTQFEEKYKDLDETAKEKKRKKLMALETKLLRARRKRINKSAFKTIEVIGRGAFGEVVLASMEGSKQAFAMKKLLKSKMLERQQIPHVRAERQALVKNETLFPDNPWITKLYYSFQDINYLYLIMEFVPGGDLMYWLIAKDVFSEEDTKYYIAETILAIESIHKLSYIHRDIKPDNLLIDKDGHIKLSDFGLCTGLETTRVDQLRMSLSSESAQLTDNDKNSIRLNQKEKFGTWKQKKKKKED